MAEPGSDALTGWLQLLKSLGGASAGVVLVVVLYIYVGKPELDRNRIAYDEQKVIVAELQKLVIMRQQVTDAYVQAAVSQESAGQTVLQAAVLLDSVSKRLDSITDKVLEAKLRTQATVSK